MRTMSLAVLACLLTCFCGFTSLSSASAVLYVNPDLGNDQNRGDENHPVQSLSEAIRRIPDPLYQSMEIRLMHGLYAATGSKNMPSDQLHLMRRMSPGVKVSIMGLTGKDGTVPCMDWKNSPLIYATEGDWWIENLQIAQNSQKQRRGIMVEGPAHVTLKNVTIRTRSQSDAAIYVHRGGKVSLRGHININEHLHDQAPEESFAGIIADDHGLIQFVEREGASLQIGNGSLSVMYYGVIRLGCETARITSWGDQSNTLAINNGGRIDLHNTDTILCAKKTRNTPIGLEDDGHILGEGAHVTIIGENENAIVLQKASTFTCNDIELKGAFKNAVQAMSGSMFVGRFLGDVPGLHATTGASVNIEAAKGKITGPVTATNTGMISLPDRIVTSRQKEAQQ